MNIRQTTAADRDEVLKLYEEARQFMREHGNPTQWGSSHPPVAQVEQDIADGKSFVCEEDGVLLGVFYFAHEIEHTYDRIYEGAWIGDGPYAVMHRVACPGRKKGTATFCLEWCMEHCGDLRIDTHRNNIPMQNLLAKNGFTRCGIIYLEDGDERIAYEKCRSCEGAEQ